MPQPRDLHPALRTHHDELHDHAPCAACGCSVCRTDLTLRAWVDERSRDLPALLLPPPPASCLPRWRPDRYPFPPP